MKYLASLVILLAIAAACGGNDATSSGAPTPSPLSEFRVTGIAMWPALEAGDVVEAMPYGDAQPQRGDIIVFRDPIGQQRVFIKRIIGLPGENVAINESTGVVSVNGQPIDEPYVHNTFGCSYVCTWSLPAAGSPEAQGQCGSERCYLVLGDNRPNSADSRQGWLVPAENIHGYIAAEGR